MSTLVPVRTCPFCEAGEYIGRQERRDFYDCGHSGPSIDEPAWIGPVHRTKPAPPKARPRRRQRGKK